MQRGREAHALDDVVRPARPPPGQRLQHGMLADNPQLLESEILHDARGGADVARFPRLDQNDAQHGAIIAVILSRADGEGSQPPWTRSFAALRMTQSYNLRHADS